MKVLDYSKRKIPFILTDSTNSNKEDIEIEIKLTSKYNEDTLEYEDTLFYGNPKMDFEEIRANIQTQLDKVLAIVYINPVYDIEISKKEFFKFKESDNKEKGLFFSNNITTEISNFIYNKSGRWD